MNTESYLSLGDENIFLSSSDSSDNNTTSPLSTYPNFALMLHRKRCCSSRDTNPKKTKKKKSSSNSIEEITKESFVAVKPKSSSSSDNNTTPPLSTYLNFAVNYLMLHRKRKRCCSSRDTNPKKAKKKKSSSNSIEEITKESFKAVKPKSSSSSDNNTTPPLSTYPNFALMLHRKRCCSSRDTNPKKTKKKKSSSNSIEEITKESFEAVKPKSFSSWVKSQFLGKGSYGYVFLATSKDKDKTLVAIKSAEISRASSLMDEHRILTRLSSPFVVRCFGHEIVREKLGGLGWGKSMTDYNLILEYCSGKSIADLIETHRSGLNESCVKVLVRDMLFGLHYIHSKRIIHCDVKPDNVLLMPMVNRYRPDGYMAKIADFGLSMDKGSVEYGKGSGHHRGTTRSMAPELIRCGILDYGVDVWALGCTVLEMLTGQVAWGEHCGLNMEGWCNLIGGSDCIPYIPDWLSEEAQDFLRRCLVKDPSSR